MIQEAQHLPKEDKCAVEIVVSISKDLGQQQRNLVMSSLEKTNAIIGAGFCLMRNHLVLANYDKNIMSSRDVLKSFNAWNPDARLIGSI